MNRRNVFGIVVAPALTGSMYPSRRKQIHSKYTYEELLQIYFAKFQSGYTIKLHRDGTALLHTRSGEFAALWYRAAVNEAVLKTLQEVQFWEQYDN